MIYLHCCNGTLLTPTQLVHQDPKVLLCKAASSQSVPNQFCCMELLLQLQEVSVSVFLHLVRIPMDDNHAYQ